MAILELFADLCLHLPLDGASIVFNFCGCAPWVHASDFVAHFLQTSVPKKDRPAPLQELLDCACCINNERPSIHVPIVTQTFERIGASAISPQLAARCLLLYLLADGLGEANVLGPAPGAGAQRAAACMYIAALKQMGGTLVIVPRVATSENKSGKPSLIDVQDLQTTEAQLPMQIVFTLKSGGIWQGLGRRGLDPSACIREQLNKMRLLVCWSGDAATRQMLSCADWRGLASTLLYVLLSPSFLQLQGLGELDRRDLKDFVAWFIRAPPIETALLRKIVEPALCSLRLLSTAQNLGLCASPKLADPAADCPCAYFSGSKSKREQMCLTPAHMSLLQIQSHVTVH